MRIAQNRWLEKFIFLVCLSAVILAAYIDGIDAPFVLDDPRVVERALKIRDLSNFLDFKQAFTARPLVNFSFALNYEMAGLDVKIYHLTNIILHILTTILVFFLAGQIFPLADGAIRPEAPGRPDFRLAPYFTAALFALHPIQSQAVIYISQRAALMACLFYLLAVICYIHARRRVQESSDHPIRASLLFFILCLLFAIMAFLSKKNAASLPAMILMVEFLIFSDSRTPWGKKLIIVFMLAILMGVGFAWFAGAFKGDLANFFDRVDRLTRETTDISRGSYLITQFTVILLYLRLIAFPNGLNIDHGFPMKKEFFQDFTPYAFLILVIILIVAVVSAKRHKLLSFGIFWFLIALSVESSIIPIRDAMFEHRVYLAFPGICIIFADLLMRVVPGKTTIKPWIAGLVILICAVGVYHRVQNWESELSLWRASVEKAPRNGRAWNNYGNALLKDGNRQAAFNAYRQAVAVSPSYSRPYCNLGKLYAENRDFEKAENLFLQSLERDPSFVEAHNNLAIIYMYKNDFEKGIAHFEKAVKLDPEQAMAHYNLGKAYLDLKFRLFQKAI